MNSKTTNFLFGCRNLYLLEIHPFDFRKTDTKEYKGLIELGKEIIENSGIQNFIKYVEEYQYRVGVWSSYIILEFGKLEQNEVIKINEKERILNVCLEKIKQNKINELTPEIIENKENWIIKIKNVLQHRV